MKKILYPLVFLVGFTSTQAQEITDKRIEDLSKKICSFALAVRTLSASTAGEDIEDIILNFLDTNRDNPNYKAIITKFWNENNEKLICYEGPADETRSPQHFMKRIVDLGMYSTVLNGFLLSNPFKYPIDVNAVEIYNGKEETLLDYLDEIISNPESEKRYNIQEMESLRRLLLMGYKAKKASELKK